MKRHRGDEMDATTGAGDVSLAAVDFIGVLKQDTNRCSTLLTFAGADSTTTRSLVERVESLFSASKIELYAGSVISFKEVLLLFYHADGGKAQQHTTRQD